MPARLKWSMLGLALAAIAAPARANPVQINLGFMTYEVDDVPDTSKSANGGPLSLSDSNIYRTESASVQFTPELQVSVSDTSTSQFAYGQSPSDYAEIDYKFAVIGTTATDVHLIFQGHAQAFASAYTGTAYAEGSVDVFGPQSFNITYALSCTGSCYGQYYKLTQNPVHEDITVGQVYTVRLRADGYANYYNGTFSAMADPTITFDPNYAIPDGAQLVFSDVAPVPEPQDMPLVFLGLGALGLMALKWQKDAGLDLRCGR